MYKKLCCYCLKVSVSADYLMAGDWQCTHCGHDITGVPAIPYQEEFSKDYLMKLVTYKKEKRLDSSPA
ncbi:hypothetical protein [Aneurinibacillus danicus]|uniref:Uncharacterized protein n=1 Tax=Aneurinibacillus danicus TaxID=267746 RepID=A0A511V8K2_9BACL|nr:hypothetical protein [Aneurinibacillus danicus]GEN34013.1 hypothetical protein ADA01nite_14730 [Aneurinibacillus danicus]